MRRSSGCRPLPVVLLLLIGLNTRKTALARPWTAHMPPNTMLHQQLAEPTVAGSHKLAHPTMSSVHKKKYPMTLSREIAPFSIDCVASAGGRCCGPSARSSVTHASHPLLAANTGHPVDCATALTFHCGNCERCCANEDLGQS